MASNVGRNVRCPCGSGRKYKKCHGAPRKQSSPSDQGVVDGEKQNVLPIPIPEEQRRQQQGLGNPIVSGVCGGQRYVDVGGRRLFSATWKTFHDFLLSYLKEVLADVWSDEAISRRHKLITWAVRTSEYMRAHQKPNRAIQTAPASGAVEGCLRLAYNLYLLADNAEVHDYLLLRLKNPDQFDGAYYETSVAAAFIKAGFRLELENERDVTRKHCEFTATYMPTAERFSVEAKARVHGKRNSDVGNQLYAALCKDADHDRVVFIEIRIPETEGSQEPALMGAITSVKQREPKLLIQGTPAPSAYVFLTNNPIEGYLDSAEYPSSHVAVGFKIPDFGYGTTFRGIREARLAREKHAAMTHLLKSINEYHRVPITFDGDIPELAFDALQPRLIIGHRYLVPDADGRLRPGVLTHATIIESSKTVVGAYQLENGQSLIASCPASDEEVAAWQAHPDTMFGRYHEQSRSIGEPLEMFDWFFSVYSRTPRANLLELLGPISEQSDVAALEQHELATLYAERLTENALRNRSSVTE